MTIRKNFLLDEDTAKHLEAIAKKEATTQTQIIKSMIEEKYLEVSKEEKLKAFSHIIGSSTSLFIDTNIQTIKENMHV